MRYGQKIKHKWLLDENITFLNHGSFGATPKPVLQALNRYHEQLERQPVHFFIDELPMLLRGAADKLAEFLGAKGEDIAFIDNATTGVNTVLRSLMNDFKPGDEIITTQHIYPAVRNALNYVAKITGVIIKEVRIPFPVFDNREIIDTIRINLSKNTRLAVFDHISSPTALVFPVKELSQICSMNNTLVLIDGAHAPGMLNLNLEDICCDWYIGNCHKWLFAPKGCAFLWTLKERQAITHPMSISLWYNEGYTKEFDWTGTKDPAAWLSIVDSIAFYDACGGEQLKIYNHELAITAAGHLASELNIEMTAPAHMLGSMVTLQMPMIWEVTHEKTMELRNEMLSRYNIEIPFMAFGGKMWFRISAQIYNELSDYNRLADALLDFIEVSNCQGGV